MDEKIFYITKSKFQELKNEYQELLDLEHKKSLGQEVPKILESEDLNPEFVSFQEDVGFLRSRIDELENIEKLVRFIGLSGIDGINYSSAAQNIHITKYKAERYITFLPQG